YEFYKLVKADSKIKTVNIFGAGYYDLASENEKVSTLPNPEITQFDSLSTKTTYVKISFDQMEYVDKMRIETTGPKFYNRKARLCTKKIVKVKQREEKTYFQTIKQIELVSGKETEIRFSDYPAKELYLIIANNDNQPLRVKSVSASKFNHYLTSYLEHDKQYVIKFGSNKIRRPVYDIAYFKSHIPKNPQNIHATDIVDLRKEKRTIITSFLNDKAWIWIAIIVVIGILGALSMKMIKEMDLSSS
ncbi:MAG: hypothetical protein JKY33_00605, partial [Bacteroidia bacterium]|nr:hypothetical protein [Bacteroidia bacterium]